jgi:hypothetical protein
MLEFPETWPDTNCRVGYVGVGTATGERAGNRTQAALIKFKDYIAVSSTSKYFQFVTPVIVCFFFWILTPYNLEKFILMRR